MLMMYKVNLPRQPYFAGHAPRHAQECEAHGRTVKWRSATLSRRRVT